MANEPTIFLSFFFERGIDFMTGTHSHQRRWNAHLDNWYFASYRIGGQKLYIFTHLIWILLPSWWCNNACLTIKPRRLKIVGEPIKSKHSQPKMKFHCSTDFLPIHVKHTFRLIRLIQLIVLYILKDRAISIASK